MIPAILLSVLLATSPASAAENVQVNTIDLLPAEDELPGWGPGERRTVSSSRGLYDYMNGGAEVYLDYGFQDLAVGEWISPGGDPLKVEVYRMGSAKSAYGMFTQDTWGEDTDVGRGAQIQGGILRFWKGEYFVRVFMWRGYEEYLTTIRETGRSVARRITSEEDVPALVSLLPVKGRVPGGVHFFHTSLTLSTFYYLSEKNPLGLSDLTDGVIGEYELAGEGQVFLVLVSYPDVTSAAEALEGFRREAGTGADILTEGQRGRGAVIVEDEGLWRKAVQRNAYLALALDCPSRDSCGAMIATLESRLEGFSGRKPEAVKEAEIDCTD